MQHRRHWTRRGRRAHNRQSRQPRRIRVSRPAGRPATTLVKVMAVRPRDTPTSGIEAGGRIYSMSEKRPAAHSDAELIAGCLRDEAWATAALWERTYPLVHRVLSRAVGPAHDVDDLLQEVF